MEKTLGQRLRELRDKEDLSLRELGERIGGKSAAFLSDIEFGRRFPSDDVLRDLAKALKTSFEDLKKRDSRPPIEDVRSKTQAEPAFAFALRTAIKEGLTADDLLKAVKKKAKKT